MSSSPAALIYAELLSNIRQVSVIASLKTPSSPESRAMLSNDRKYLELIHDGRTVRLVLPGQVAESAVLQQPRLRSLEISWRLPLASTESVRTGADLVDTASSPWSAGVLSDLYQFSCRKCGNILLPAGRVQTWKNLPSDNWAEMMDFWHCHKPDIANNNDSNVDPHSHFENRGYGANSQFAARKGVGLVDLRNFILFKEDCCGIKPDEIAETPSNMEPPQSICCNQCGTTIGVLDTIADGFRVYKWSLSSSTVSSDQQYTYPLSHFISAYLVSQISLQAVNKFILNAIDISASDLPTLYIWIFAPFLTVSFSSIGNEVPRPIPASKVFYRYITANECTSILEKANMDVEEVRLPEEVMIELTETLRESTASIPESTRNFREWKVGFLERFVSKDNE